MQLEQQETFEIKSPQLEVFGQVESLSLIHISEPTRH